MGGIGGLLFVAVVVAQNIIRAASLPAAEATPPTIVDKYGANTWTTPALFATFVISGVGLVTFTAVLVDRLRDPRARWLAMSGGIGVVMVAVLFSLTLALDTALAMYIRRGEPSAEVVEAMWILHNAVFGVLQVAIGVALAGLSGAAVSNGLVDVGWRRAGLVGAVTLAVSSAATPAVLDGSPLMGIGLVGFVIWLAFVARTSVALLQGATESGGSR